MPKLCSRKTSFIYFLIMFAVAIAGGACTSRKINSQSIRTFEQTETSRLLNANTANVADFEKIPRIGPALAKKIIEHRDRYGPFRKVEHLLLVEGVSQERYREIRKFVKVE